MSRRPASLRASSWGALRTMGPSCSDIRGWLYKRPSFGPSTWQGRPGGKPRLRSGLTRGHEAAAPGRPEHPHLDFPYESRHSPAGPRRIRSELSTLREPNTGRYRSRGQAPRRILLGLTLRLVHRAEQRFDIAGGASDGGVDDAAHDQPQPGDEDGNAVDRCGSG